MMTALSLKSTGHYGQIAEVLNDMNFDREQSDSWGEIVFQDKQLGMPDPSTMLFSSYSALFPPTWSTLNWR